MPLPLVFHKRLYLYINGVLAIKSAPIEKDKADKRIEQWKQVFGSKIKVEYR